LSSTSACTRGVDQPERVLGQVAIVGHNQCDDFPDVSHLVDGQGALGARLAERRVGNQEWRRLVELAEVRRGEHQMNPWCAPGG
jgi:hypothetical protein